MMNKTDQILCRAIAAGLACAMYSLTLSPASADECTTFSNGDANCNSVINFEDFAIFSPRLGTTDTLADFDNDGLVSFADFLVLASNYDQFPPDQVVPAGGLTLVLDGTSAHIHNPGTGPAALVGYSLLSTQNLFATGAAASPFSFLLADTSSQRDAGMLGNAVDIPAGGSVFLGTILASPVNQLPGNLRFRYSISGSDAVVSGTVEIALAPMILVTVQRTGTDLTVTFPAGEILQQADTVLGPWKDVTDAISPFTLILTNREAFFRTSSPTPPLAQ